MTLKGNLTLISAALTLSFLFAGCAGGVPPRPPIAEERITALNAMGKQAFERADYASAYNLYSRALKGAISIEKPSSIAINAINAAAALRGAGKLDEANDVLDILLIDGPVTYSAGHLSSAAYLRSAIYLDGANTGDAQAWAEKSINLCKKGGCAPPSGVNVVMASLALMGGDAEQALAHAKLVKSDAPAAERANALRVIGDARIRLGMPEQALAHYEEALIIDKAQALSGRIGLDLMGAGRALEAMGRRAEAMERYLRALSVAKASGNATLESGATAAMESLGMADK